MKITTKQAKPFSTLAFPNYTGRKFNLESRGGKCYFYDLNWSGGTKSEYIIIELSSLEIKPVTALAPWIEYKEGLGIEIPSGFMVVCHSIFCGQDIGLTFYINPQDASKLLK